MQPKHDRGSQYWNLQGSGFRSNDTSQKYFAVHKVIQTYIFLVITWEYWRTKEREGCYTSQIRMLTTIKYQNFPSSGKRYLHCWKPRYHFSMLSLLITIKYYFSLSQYQHVKIYYRRCRHRVKNFNVINREHHMAA